MAASESSTTAKAVATQDELEDIILSARYGELEEIQQFVQKFGATAIAETRDERGNGCLHMAAANGHKDVLFFLLPLLPSETLAAVNQAGNTPLHWAAMNGHIDALRLLVPALPKSALFLKNQFGRDALSEAENAVPEGENAATSPQQECAGYLLTFMELEKEKSGNEQEVDESGEVGDTDVSGTDKKNANAASGEPPTEQLSKTSISDTKQ